MAHGEELGRALLLRMGDIKTDAAEKANKLGNMRLFLGLAC
jgi:hypothetical protein